MRGWFVLHDLPPKVHFTLHLMFSIRRPSTPTPSQVNTTPIQVCSSLQHYPTVSRREQKKNNPTYIDTQRNPNYKTKTQHTTPSIYDLIISFDNRFLKSSLMFGTSVSGFFPPSLPVVVPLVVGVVAEELPSFLLTGFLPGLGNPELSAFLRSTVSTARWNRRNNASARIRVLLRSIV